ncbi:MAG: hypothetical protein KAI81_02275 [Candidatus Marinimicrobia bacterium]|nr:hypothetical protein [Candidatus Neomarinimicrobiota bacterium]
MITPVIIVADDYTSGGYAGAYQRMPHDARSAALGNSNGAMLNDISVVSENPALAATLQGKQFSSNIQFLSLDRSMNSILFGLPLPPTAGLAFIWQHAGVGDIQGRDFSNNPTEMYSSSQDVFYVSFANNFNDKLSGGIATRIMYERLPETSATGMGLDAGLSYRPFKEVSLAASIRNIKGDITWDTEDIYTFGGRRVDSLPTRLIVSGVFRPVKKITLSLAYKGSNVIFSSLHAGLEFSLLPDLQLRAGLDDGIPSLGFGTEYRIRKNIQSRLDYAFVYGRAQEGVSHIFSFLFYLTKP